MPIVIRKITYNGPENWLRGTLAKSLPEGPYLDGRIVVETLFSDIAPVELVPPHNYEEHYKEEDSDATTS